MATPQRNAALGKCIFSHGREAEALARAIRTGTWLPRRGCGANRPHRDNAPRARAIEPPRVQRQAPKLPTA
eukprot:11224184-Lingulodinium_polyedra.AAC.1